MEKDIRGKVEAVLIKKNNRPHRFELTFENTVSFAYYKNMIVSVHLIACLVNKYFTPEWQINVRDITREIVAVINCWLLRKDEYHAPVIFLREVTIGVRV